MKLWGGRFAKKTDKLVEDFHSSIFFDQRLYQQDINGSIAHARMLGQQGIITQEEANILVKGLQEVLEDIKEGRVEFEVDAEDIHMNIEKILTERVGDVGKKLHTARSRNDQVALDLRMYLKEGIKETAELLLELGETLLNLAARHTETVMPGYTHLQKAQPITFAHHLLAYFQMFARDIDRLRDCYRRMDVMPLGSGALAGTTFPINREFVREQLGFAKVSDNSLDGVSDRDFAVEFCAAASLIMMHLSRFSEEIILWSSHEFKFIILDDGYSTGSSIMPQKKNPDVAELVRGKTGRVYGDLMGLLTMLKGLPLAYNKDMQEDKEAVFDALDTVKKCLLVFSPMLATMKVNKDMMRAGAKGGFINATDAADYLAARGVPFREAHAVVGKLVLYCEQHEKALEDLELEELQQFSPLFQQDIFQYISLDHCVKVRNVPGGPAPAAVMEAIKQGQKLLDEIREW
ncbi:MAG: argininosuccinate lyase [Bacillota bacterium]|jgi:argininosuccinate lyase|nr:argininosuccinate lyase [Clostridia bacterium]